jgi:hypothetical protein
MQRPEDNQWILLRRGKLGVYANSYLPRATIPYSLRQTTVMVDF